MSPRVLILPRGVLAFNIANDEDELQVYLPLAHSKH